MNVNRRTSQTWVFDNSRRYATSVQAEMYMTHDTLRFRVQDIEMRGDATHLSIGAYHQNAHKSADPDAREVESELQDTRQPPREIRADGCRALTEAVYRVRPEFLTDSTDLTLL